MNNSHKPDLLSYEIQAKDLRQQAFADLARAARQAVARAAVAVRDGLKAKRPVAPATRPI